MSKDKELFSEEEIDFLNEMFSIGAGNATVALTQLFGLNVDLDMPKVNVINVNNIWDTPYYEKKYMFCTITRMKLFGNILSGTYLGSISRFCRLNIVHTIPILEKNHLYSFMEKFLKEEEIHINDHILMTENRFTIERKAFQIILMIILNKDNIQKLKGALPDARAELNIIKSAHETS